VLESVFASADIERERGVILEEIRSTRTTRTCSSTSSSRQASEDHSARLAYSRHLEDGSKTGPDQLSVYHSDRFHGAATSSFRGRQPGSRTAFVEVRRGSSMLAGGATLNELPAPEAALASCCAKRNPWSRCNLPGRSRAAHHRQEPLRHAHLEHGPGRRHELAASSRPSARSGAWPIRSTRPEPLSRHRNLLGLCRHFDGQGPAGGGPHLEEFAS